MNARKMRQIGKDILKEPRRFNMSTWFERLTSKQEAVRANHATTQLPPCGTTCCFAGAWAIRYAGIEPADPRESVLDKQLGVVHVSDACRDDLKLPNLRLFYTHRWPTRLQTILKAGTVRYAKHFVEKVLEDYIATNGWESEGCVDD